MAQRLIDFVERVVASAVLNSIIGAVDELIARNGDVANALGRIQSAVGAVGGLIDRAGGLVGRASDGPVNAGQAYVVGEKGPELFVPGTSGTIIPNTATPNRATGGGRSTICTSTATSVTRKN